MKKIFASSLSLVVAFALSCTKKSGNPFDTQSLYCEHAGENEIMRNDLPRDYAISLNKFTGEAVLRVYDTSTVPYGKSGKYKWIEDRKDCSQRIDLSPAMTLTPWNCAKPGSQRGIFVYPDVYEVKFGDGQQITTIKLHNPGALNDPTQDVMIQTTNKCWMGPKKTRPPAPR